MHGLHSQAVIKVVVFFIYCPAYMAERLVFNIFLSICQICLSHIRVIGEPSLESHHWRAEAELALTPYKGQSSIKQTNHGAWLVSIKRCSLLIKYISTTI